MIVILVIHWTSSCGDDKFAAHLDIYMLLKTKGGSKVAYQSPLLDPAKVGVLCTGYDFLHVTIKMQIQIGPRMTKQPSLMTQSKC